MDLLTRRGRLAARLAFFGSAWLLVPAMLTWAQTLPPGSLPPGPPPQPGQLGPAPEKTPPAATALPNGPNIAATPTEYTTDKDGFRIPVYVRNVLVPTTVLDPDGHGYVNGLQRGEFELLDNGKPQNIQAEFTQLPMSVVLVVQANADIEAVLPTLKKSGVLLHGLVTGQDSDIAVISFDHIIHDLQGFTTDPDKLDDAMQKLTAGSSSARLNDAVLRADAMLKKHDPRGNRRRIIVLVSRNTDKGSESKLPETARQLQFDNVIAYCIDISKVYTGFMKPMPYPRPEYGGLPPESMPNAGAVPRTQTTNVQQQDGNWLNLGGPVYRGVRDLFKKTPAEVYAEFTGGRIYGFAKQRGFEYAIADIGADLNSQYLLSYSPNNSSEPGFHTIKVSVNRPGLYVHVRPGYWTAGGQQP